MDKLDGNSMNIVNDNIEKLKDIFPEVFIVEFGKLIKKIAKSKEEIKSETIRVVCKYLVDKSNAFATLKQFDIDTVVSV